MKFSAPADCTSASFDGVEYPVKDGILEVPDEVAAGVVPALGPHGFAHLPEDAEPAPAPAAKPARKKSE